MSSDPEDPGYQAWMQASAKSKTVVYVDGVRVDKAFTADTDAGYVLAADLGPDEQLQLNGARDDVLRRELRGTVTIALEPK
jgi:aminoglycoside/choline kinase family phosphotransferase